MKEIDWKTIKFIARPDTWFDEGTEAKLLDSSQPTHDYTCALFEGLVDGELDGEMCDIFEFDWIDKDGNYINSNIPELDGSIQYDNYVIEDYTTGEKYNWLENRKL